MKLPVDLSAVKSALDSTQQSAEEPLSVSLYIDEDSPDDVIGFVRKAFLGTDSKVRISLEYIGKESAARAGDDMACIVAGTNPEVGALAEDIRTAGVPTMVVTSLPSLVHDLAQMSGCPIPVGDIVAPLTKAPNAKGQVPEQIAEATRQTSLPSLVHDLAQMSGCPIPVGDIVAPLTKAPNAKGQVPEQIAEATRQEPIPMDKEAAESLAERMGKWVIAACGGKKLAFARAFSFVRRPLATEAVTATSVQNAGIGAFMFIPGADMPIITLNQVKMVLQIAAAYGQPMTADRLKEIAFVVAGAFACRSIARQGAGLVPALGWAVKGAVGFAGTEAMGRAVIEYFEGGGNISGLANLVKRAGGAAVQGAGRAAGSPLGQTIIDKGAKAAARKLKL